MEEKEIVVKGKKIKIVTKLNPEEIEDNNVIDFLEDTIDLESVVEQINESK